MGVGSGAHVAGSKHSRLPASGSLLRLPWEAEAADPISQGRKQAQQLEGLPPRGGDRGQGTSEPATCRPHSAPWKEVLEPSVKLLSNTWNNQHLGEGWHRLWGQRSEA